MLASGAEACNTIVQHLVGCMPVDSKADSNGQNWDVSFINLLGFKLVATNLFQWILSVLKL